MDEIISENIITDVEARELLKNRSKDAELGFETKNALEHLKKYTTMTEKKAKDLVEALKKVEKLREKQIIAIVNGVPEDKDDLRTILEKDYALFSEEEKELILETVKKFL